MAALLILVAISTAALFSCGEETGPCDPSVEESETIPSISSEDVPEPVSEPSIPSIPPVAIEAPDTVRVWEARGEEREIDLASFAHTDSGVGIEVTGEYDINVPGKYDMAFVAVNEEGIVTEKRFTLKVLALPYDENGSLVDGEYETEKGFPLIVENGITYIEGTLIANKTYPLPENYLPGEILPEAQKAFEEMQAAAPAEYRDRLYICSGYRSYAAQRYIYNNYLSYDPQDVVDTYSARPGHSEHQSGLAMDILSASSANAPLPYYKEVFDWLSENAWEYGFILRYPAEKTEITGYKFEPWHYRYVGKELAETLYNGGEWITMEEYFGIDSAYKR